MEGKKLSKSNVKLIFEQNLFFRYIVCTESGNVLIWNRITEQVLFKVEQANVTQLTLFQDMSKFIAISRPNNPQGVEIMRTTATLMARSLPGKVILTWTCIFL